MEIKTKDGKYFSELGSWKGLIEIIILLIIFKIFGLLITIVCIAINIFIIPKIFKKKDAGIKD
jgi:hypothetical protein